MPQGMPGMTVRLDTRDVDAAREHLGRSYCPYRLDPRSDGAGFRARQTEGGNAELGIFMLSYGADPVRAIPVSFDEFVLVSRPVVGRLVVRGGGREIEVGPGAVVALDPRSEHQLEFGAGGRLMTMKLPCAVLDRVAAGPAARSDASRSRKRQDRCGPGDHAHPAGPRALRGNPHRRRQLPHRPNAPGDRPMR